LIGAAIGVFYMWLCGGRNFLAIMVGFPCFLGGGLAAFVGSNRSRWLTGFGARLGKGLLAGFVLGLVYMITLNMVGSMLESPFAETGDYVRMMWRAGPIALGLASGAFLVLMRWAVGLIRLKPIFEETPPDATS
jgi:hypothetical protein